MAENTKTIAEQDKSAALGGGLDVVVVEAQRRFKYCSEWESYARKLWLDDYKFANADSDNNFQWPDEIYNERDGEDHPCLTINKVRQHNFQIVNDAKRNKPGIKYSPVGNAATQQSSNIMNGLARHVEQQSNATAVYDQATKFMVDAGFGFWRVVREHKDNASFNQELYIRPIANPLNCYLDPNATQADRIDSKYGFIIDEISREAFEVKYPKFKDYVNQDPFPTAEAGWLSDRNIRVAEYYRLQGIADVLWAYVPTGADKPLFIRESLLGPELLATVKAAQTSRSRPIVVEKLEWYLLVGNKIADKQLNEPGKYIPIVKIAGEETVIANRYDCKGHTRALKDPQRMYNYWASAGVEFGALQTKTPWVASAQAVEGYEEDWNKANVKNKAVLMYNALADDGVTIIPPPQRIMPPVSAPVALDGMKVASEEMMSVSGQYQAMLGAPSNERSGKAINERQRQGETATYHYIDAVAIGIRKTAKILLDLFPTTYDTEQVIQILQEDGKTLEIMINPNAKKAYEEQQVENSEAVTRVLNPGLGEYEVVCEVGPSFSTRREEAFQAFMGLLGQAPQLIPILGDVLFRNGDFPMSEEAAERLRRMVPSYVLGEGPTPQEAEMQQQIGNLRGMIGKLLEENAVQSIEAKKKDSQRTIDLMNAITNRLKLFTPPPQAGEIPQAELSALVHEAVNSVFATSPEADPGQAHMEAMGMLNNMPEAGGEQEPPIPGARMGADGKWYAKDYVNTKGFRPVS